MPIYREHIPEHHLKAMTFEYQMHPDEIDNPIVTARRLLNESVPYAALEIRHIALNDPDPRMRLAASQEILNRSLGKTGTGTNTDTSPSDALISDLQQMLASG